jgi:peptidoglycan biosynthesis protein MviN/MurJ (putative lipid II flippase)
VFQLGILSKLGVGPRSDLYFASIVVPMVAFTLAFGALNNVLVPMFVEAKARGHREDTTLLWNCLLVIVVGGSLLLTFLYFSARFAFPVMFRNLVWIDLHQVAMVLVAYSLYQVLYLAVLTKNCFLFSQGHPLSAQAGVFCGWIASLGLLWSIHPSQSLGRVPLCLVCGNAFALLYPNVTRDVFSYRSGLLKAHAQSLFRRTFPVTAGCSVGWIEPAFDGVIASTMKQGSLTIYFFFARMMLSTVTSIFTGYVQPVTKHLAELAGASRWEELRYETWRVARNGVSLSVGVLTAGLFTLLFLGHSKSSLLRPYALSFGHNIPVFLLLLGYLFGALGHAVFSNSLYVLHREKLYLLATISALPAGVILKLAGARILDLPGLALGTSSYWFIYAGILGLCFSWAVTKQINAALSPTRTSDFDNDEVALLK